jgi:Transposase DNA-binding/Transposase Tn5 dimerisation domain
MSSPSSLADPVSATELWASRIAGHATLADERLNTRLELLLSALAAQPSDSLPQACGSSGQAQAAYRFFANERIGPDDLLQPVADAASDICRGLPTILAVQDSSSLNFTTLRTTKGLGPLNDSPNARGLHMHTTLAVRPDGVALGILDQIYWARPETVTSAPQREERCIEDKESYKWLLGIEAAEAAWETLPGDQRPRLIHVMDREGDVHEVMQRVTHSPHYAIIRCAQNRSVAGPIDKAFAASEAAPLLATVTIDLPSPHSANASAPRPRQVRLNLRKVELTLCPHPQKHPLRQPLTWTLIEACEAEPAAGSEPLHWRLWTNLSIATLDDLLEALRFYMLRWRVEDFHLTLKSGCQIEKLELEDAERLIKAAVLYSAVAIRIVALRDLARVEPNTSCAVILTADEWQPLWQRFSKKRLTAQTVPPTLEQAVRWIGRLGGHLARKRDGMPGVRTLWRGFRDLTLLAAGFHLGKTTLR